MGNKFLLLAALRIEYQAILHRFDVVTILADDEAVVRIGEMEGVAACPPRVGRIDAAISTTRAIARHDPDVVVLVGICGGFEDQRVKVGDVLVSSVIVDYEFQRITREGRVPRLRIYSAANELVAAAERAKTSWQPPTADAKCFVGPLFSGDKLVVSQDFVDELQRWSRALPPQIAPALGIEMEGSGVAAAADAATRPFIVVRGVADLATEAKSDDFQQEAAEVAADFAWSLIAEYHRAVSDRRNSD